MIKKLLFIALIVWSFPSAMAAASAEDTSQKPRGRFQRLEGSSEAIPHNEPVDQPRQPLELSILPEELLVHIFSFLGSRDLGNTALVCKDFNRLRFQAPYELKMGGEELEFIRNSRLPGILPPFINSRKVTAIKISCRTRYILTPLLAVLPYVPHLHTLDLGYNNIGEGGMTALAAALGNVPHLHTLDLGYNNIGEGGMTALAAALGNVPHLHTLDVSFNSIGEGGVTALAAALRNVPQLNITNLTI